MSYESAINACKSAGGNLVSIHSKEENNIVQDLLGCGTVPNDGNSCGWIGMMYSKDRRSRWAWVDGTRKNYTNWERGEPSNMHGNPRTCAAMKNNGVWHNILCTEELKPVCKTRDRRHCPRCTRTSSSTSSTTTSTSPSSSSTTTKSSTKTTTTPKPEWIYYKETDACYKLLSPMSYESGMKACKSAGGDLVSIHSKEENAIVQGLLGCGTVSNGGASCGWIGMRYTKDRRSRWIWVDGTRKNYTNWERGEPSNMHDNPRTCAAGVCYVMAFIILNYAYDPETKAKLSFKHTICLQP
ncbi:hypothetical protein Aduo_018570 [Ancylostoma duodenale]